MPPLPPVSGTATAARDAASKSSAHRRNMSFMGTPAAMMIAKMPSASRLLPAFAVVLALAAQAPPPPRRLLFSDDFTQGLSRWSVELERPGLVEAKGGILKIDV